MFLIKDNNQKNYINKYINLVTISYILINTAEDQPILRNILILTMYYCLVHLSHVNNCVYSWASISSRIKCLFI